MGFLAFRIDHMTIPFYHVTIFIPHESVTIHHVIAFTDHVTIPINCVTILYLSIVSMTCTSYSQFLLGFTLQQIIENSSND